MAEVEISFYVSERRLGDVKKKIRALSSVRFNYNPLQIRDSYNLSVSGNADDINKLNAYLAEIEKADKPSKIGFLEKIATAFGFG